MFILYSNFVPETPLKTLMAMQYRKHESMKLIQNDVHTGIMTSEFHKVISNGQRSLVNYDTKEDLYSYKFNGELDYTAISQNLIEQYKSGACDTTTIVPVTNTPFTESLEAETPMIEVVENTIIESLDAETPMLEVVENANVESLEAETPMIEVVENANVESLETESPMIEVVEDTNDESLEAETPMIEVVENVNVESLETKSPMIEVVENAIIRSLDIKTTIFDTMRSDINDGLSDADTTTIKQLSDAKIYLVKNTIIERSSNKMVSLVNNLVKSSGTATKITYLIERDFTETLNEEMINYLIEDIINEVHKLYSFKENLNDELTYLTKNNIKERPLSIQIKPQIKPQMILSRFNDYKCR
jgi:hypothetical protein